MNMFLYKRNRPSTHAHRHTASFPPLLRGIFPTNAHKRTLTERRILAKPNASRDKSQVEID